MRRISPNKDIVLPTIETNIGSLTVSTTHYTTQTNRALLAECLRNNKVDAWQGFVRRFQPIISRAIGQVVNERRYYSSGVVQQLTQDTFVKLCERNCARLKKLTLPDDGALFGYLKVVARNLALDYIRKPGEHPRVCVDDLEAADEYHGRFVPRGLLPSQKQVLLREIEKCISRVTRGQTASRDRLVFWLHHRQGFTAREIALLPAVNLTEKGVESLLRRIFILLKSEVAGKHTFAIPANA